MDAKSVGLLLVGAGAVLAVIGFAVMAGLLSWFGRLPGDIRHDSGDVRVYAPIASMLVISLLLSLALLVFNRLR